MANLFGALLYLASIANLEQAMTQALTALVVEARAYVQVQPLVSLVWPAVVWGWLELLGWTDKLQLLGRLYAKTIRRPLPCIWP